MQTREQLRKPDTGPSQEVAAVLEKTKAFSKGLLDLAEKLGRKQEIYDGVAHIIATTEEGQKRKQEVLRFIMAKKGELRRLPKETSQVPTPVRAEPTPVRAEPTPVRAEPTPVRAEPTPVRAEPTPVRAEPTPVRAEPTPVEPRPTPVKEVPDDQNSQAEQSARQKKKRVRTKKRKHGLSKTDRIRRWGRRIGLTLGLSATLSGKPGEYGKQNFLSPDTDRESGAPAEALTAEELKELREAKERQNQMNDFEQDQSATESRERLYQGYSELDPEFAYVNPEETFPYNPEGLASEDAERKESFFFRSFIRQLVKKATVTVFGSSSIRGNTNTFAGKGVSSVGETAVWPKTLMSHIELKTPPLPESMVGTDGVLDGGTLYSEFRYINIQERPEIKRATRKMDTQPLIENLTENSTKNLKNMLDQIHRFVLYCHKHNMRAHIVKPRFRADQENLDRMWALVEQEIYTRYEKDVIQLDDILGEPYDPNLHMKKNDPRNHLSNRGAERLAEGLATWLPEKIRKEWEEKHGDPQDESSTQDTRQLTQTLEGEKQDPVEEAENNPERITEQVAQTVAAQFRERGIVPKSLGDKNIWTTMSLPTVDKNGQSLLESYWVEEDGARVKKFKKREAKVDVRGYHLGVLVGGSTPREAQTRGLCTEKKGGKFDVIGIKSGSPRMVEAGLEHATKKWGLELDGRLVVVDLGMMLNVVPSDSAPQSKIDWAKKIGPKQIVNFLVSLKEVGAIPVGIESRHYPPREQNIVWVLQEAKKMLEEQGHDDILFVPAHVTVGGSKPDDVQYARKNGKMDSHMTKEHMMAMFDWVNNFMERVDELVKEDAPPRTEAHAEKKPNGLDLSHVEPLDPTGEIKQLKGGETYGIHDANTGNPEHESGYNAKLYVPDGEFNGRVEIIFPGMGYDNEQTADLTNIGSYAEKMWHMGDGTCFAIVDGYEKGSRDEKTRYGELGKTGVFTHLIEQVGRQCGTRVTHVEFTGHSYGWKALQNAEKIADALPVTTAFNFADATYEPDNDEYATYVDAAHRMLRVVVRRDDMRVAGPARELVDSIAKNSQDPSTLELAKQGDRRLRLGTYEADTKKGGRFSIDVVSGRKEDGTDHLGLANYFLKRRLRSLAENKLATRQANKHKQSGT